ncbi:glycosyltransferase family 2 protein [Mangrovicella endophytica]|uniref:glycosyltransferase family 2 protein n=1 Tax=Mangrovicella endophytica TaxID=2066697 RepID=UPI000C9E7886|nr:glycosyltransferase family 2 protein [Mangrovicella endophytica]
MPTLLDDFPVERIGRSYDRSGNESKGDSKASPGQIVRLVSAVDTALRLASVEPWIYAAARDRARRLGTDAASELVAAGIVSRGRLAAAMAASLGLPRGAILPEDTVIGDVPSGPVRLVKTCDAGLVTRIFVDPLLETLDAAAELLDRHPNLRGQTFVATAREISAALGARSRVDRAQSARLSLSADEPLASARSTLTGTQGLVLGCGGTILAVALLSGSVAAGLFLHVAASILFFGTTMLRLLARLHLKRRPAVPITTDAGSSEKLPFYSVVVALHREESVVPTLVAALSLLEWPVSRIEIKLVCEADDAGTIRAVRHAIAGRAQFEVVAVPPSEPRTKPKALNYALPLTRGELLVLYDAEDIPHPTQLREAHARFQQSDERLACLQAPLTIHNAGKSWLSDMFALEYAALFRGLLPLLADQALPMPLGGTSNHFRRAALVAVGGWDSHNVTEDADLGMRLYRRGYRCGTITAPTYEEAPHRWRIWRNQRTRWMKGWMQTYCVHMRQPVRLWQELGAKAFVTFQLLFFGMIASSMAHPFFLGLSGWTIWTMATEGAPNLLMTALLVLDLVNVVLGYAATAMLIRTVLKPRERTGLGLRLLGLYPYWLLLSFAAFRAALQLLHAPHRWEKTPHGGDAASAARRHDAGSQDLAPLDAGHSLEARPALG